MEENITYHTGFGVEIPNEFITLIIGKGGKQTPFIRLPGLIRIAHKHAEKLGGMLTQLGHETKQLPTKENGYECIIVTSFAVITKDDKIICRFTKIGDANPENVNSMVRKHIIRMAESRSVARVLRVMTDVGMTALEELDETSQEGYGDYPEYHRPESGGSSKPPKKPSKNTSKFIDDEHKNLYEAMIKLKEKNELDNKALRNIVSELRGESFSGTKYDITKEEYRKIIEQMSVEPVDKINKADIVQSIIVLRKNLGMSMEEFNNFAKDRLGLKTKDVKASELTDEQLNLLNEELKLKTKEDNVHTTDS